MPNAGVVDVNLKVIGLAAGIDLMDKFRLFKISLSMLKFLLL
jgi:hypothetical protein